MYIPLSQNLYTYVENNPLKHIDPSGHKTCDTDGNCEPATVLPSQNWSASNSCGDGCTIVDVTQLNDFELASIATDTNNSAETRQAAITELQKRIIVPLDNGFGAIARGTRGIFSSIAKFFKTESNAEETLQITVSLSNKLQKHILNGHMPDRFAKQVPYLTDEQLTKYLNDNTFFNSSWSEGTIIEGVTEAYSSALQKGAKGTYDYYYNGEYIRLFIDDNGNLSSAYGLNVLTKSYFSK